MKRTWSLTLVIMLVLSFFVVSTGTAHAWSLGWGSKSDAPNSSRKMECDPDTENCEKPPTAPAAPTAPATIPEALAAPAEEAAPAAPAIDEESLVSKFVAAMQGELDKTKEGFKEGLAKLEGKTAKATEGVKKDVGALKKSVDTAVGSSKYWAGRAEVRAKESRDYAMIANTAAGKSEASAKKSEEAAGKSEASAKKSEEAAGKSEASAKKSEEAASRSFLFMIGSILAFVATLGTAVFFYRKVKKASKAPGHRHERASDRSNVLSARDLEREDVIKKLRGDLRGIEEALTAKRRELRNLGKGSPEAKNIQDEIGELVGKQVNAEDEIAHLERQ